SQNHHQTPTRQIVHSCKENSLKTFKMKKIHPIVVYLYISFTSMIINFLFIHSFLDATLLQLNNHLL
ncbi:hypothetical protein EWB00_003822, partial [Schistosoma japonicum]